MFHWGREQKILKSRQLSAVQQHFFFRLSSFFPAGEKIERPRTFLPCHPPPPASTKITLPGYMQQFDQTAQDFKPSGSWFKVTWCWLIDRMTQRRVKGRAERMWWHLSSVQCAKHSTSLPFQSKANWHLWVYVVSAWVLPVRGGQEVGCSVPDSAGPRWHGCCRPVWDRGGQIIESEIEMPELIHLKHDCGWNQRQVK